MFRRTLALISASFVLLPLAAQQGDRQGEVQAPVPSHIVIPPAPILSPEDALRTLKVPAGYRIELVAADPLVHDPVAMTFGPDGRIWVAEMRSYMLNADGANENTPNGTIAVLADTDGDGRMDKRTVFAEGLIMPRALALVDDGLLVAEPPHLWFLRDTDGDGKADVKTEVASDYGQAGNPEHTANGLLWAQDNWIYSAKHDVRFRYEGGGTFKREPTIARGQWGISQDSYGRLHHNTNSDPLHADLVPAEYLLRNPQLTALDGARVRLVPADLRIFPGRVTPGVNRGYQILDEEGKIRAMTAACSPLVYRGALFPADFQDNAFVAEPSANLVKRIVLTDGADGTRTGRSAYEETEFLTSTDERFRPVNLYEGPDGGIYVVDLYRGILQHRIFLTSFLRKQIEERGLDQGVGLGRIYRIVPENAPPARVTLDLSKASKQTLVAQLGAAGGWWRDTAQRILVERRDVSVAPALRKVARDKSAASLARIHALWTLDGLGQLDRASVEAALDSRDDAVRAAGARLAEAFISERSVREKLVRLATAKKQHPRVVLHATLVLGSSPSPETIASLVAIARTHGKLPYLASAIVSGLATRENEFVSALLSGRANDQSEPALALAANAILKSGDAARISSLLAAVAPNASTPAWARNAILDGVQQLLPRGMRGRGTPPPASLPAEPVALVALSKATGHPSAARAETLLKSLRWPGKEGVAAPIVATRLNEAESARFEHGKAQYAMICAACHQPNGEGMPGLAPALVNSRHVVGDEKNLARIILNGKEGGGLMMPPLAVLDDDAIAGVMTYVRRSWGHTASPVTPEFVKEAREQAAKRTQPWNDEELLAGAK